MGVGEVESKHHLETLLKSIYFVPFKHLITGWKLNSEIAKRKRTDHVVKIMNSSEFPRASNLIVLV